MITVQRLSWIPRMVRNPFWERQTGDHPGRAIGRMISSETTFRPKNRVRRSAIAASVPSSSATTVAAIATLTLVHSADRAPWLSQATLPPVQRSRAAGSRRCCRC